VTRPTATEEQRERTRAYQRAWYARHFAASEAFRERQRVNSRRWRAARRPIRPATLICGWCKVEIPIRYHGGAKQRFCSKRCAGCADRVTHRDRINANARKRYAKNPAKFRALGRADHARNPFRKYGMTRDDFERLKIQQGGVCAICGKIPPRWQVDHDHATEIVRGLLCISCNLFLGKYEQHRARLGIVAAYLERTTHA